MTKRIRWVVILTLITMAASDAIGAGFSATSMMFPFRSVADTEDIYALRYNPAGMAFDLPVEFAFVHQFGRVGPGGDNSLMLRAKTLAASVNWIKNRGSGKQREYMVGAGHAVSPKVSVGTTYSYFKADAEDLNGKHTWTHSLFFRYSPMITAGIRWENPWHTEISGQPTDGLIVAGVSVSPMGTKVRIHADVFYPDENPSGNSFLKGSAQVQLNRDIDLAGFVDTEGRFGIEFRLMRERSAAGVELRGNNLDNYDTGTMYISVLDGLYRKEPRPGSPGQW